ncbi:MAG: DNA translocase FtsK [Chloroflexi bacterium]|nr:DNA translocase FtsK [Chloroflexota bacterium]
MTLTLLGVFTILALLSRPGALTGWWVEQITLALGYGRYFFPVVLMVVGVYLFLRGGGYASDVSATRILGLVLMWIAFQASAHLLPILLDPFALESVGPGEYGGWLGWMLSENLLQVMSEGAALVFMFLLGVFGLVLVLGRSFDDILAFVVTASYMVMRTIRALLRRESDQTDAHGPARPSLWSRLRGWLSRRPSPALPSGLFDDANGPVTTLPPDPSVTPPAHLAEAEIVSPAARIIGGEQTNWRLPRIDHILDDLGGGELTEEDLAERARIIEETLHAFGVPVTVTEVNRGPVVTQFGLRPEYIIRKVRGEEKRVKVRVSQIQALANDLSLALAAAPIRIEAPVPGRNIVGLEVPNQSVAIVTLRSILESEEFRRLKAPLRIALGQDVSGRAVAASLARMPHLLVAGATGSGKSVCINSIICSLLFQYTPDQLRFVMVDPKRVELTGYNGIPHLVDQVVTDVEKVIGVLHWATTEMDRRYKELERSGARNIEAYNMKRMTEGQSIMPYVVIVVDELADIMMMAPDEVERSLVRLAQMARATGIHLVIATQRPSVNVVTGLIKANFPSRIAFAVTSQIDSRVILDTPGAERLLGRGDMLFMRPDSAKLARLQGAFVSDAEVMRLVRYWRGLGAPPAAGVRPLDEVIDQGGEIAPEGAKPVQRPLWDDMLVKAQVESKKDVLYDEAVALVRESGRASTSLLQRKLRIGYTRAARLIDLMEEEGVVGPDLGGSRGREVLPFEPETEASEGDSLDEARHE